MAITDLVGNALTAPNAIGQMVGYIEPLAPAEVLPLRMYDFLIEPIRLEDHKDGGLFVQRYLQGSQELWEQDQGRIFSMKDLWSLTDCPDEFLIYLKDIVGWTKELNYITDELDLVSLRRLIGVSAALWKTRGPESAILDVLSLLTGERLRIWNWFDYRFIIDETEMGIEHQGRDPWMLTLPGAPDYQEYRSNLRITDSGSLNRQLVEDVANLMRALGERIEVSYIDFLDLFDIADDLSQWDASSAVASVNNGYLSLTGSIDIMEINTEGAIDWKEYVVAARVRITYVSASSRGGILFYRTSPSSYYAAAIDIANSAVVLRNNAGTLDNQPVGYPLFYGVWYMLRIQMIEESTGLRIQVFLDGDEIINYYDASPLTKGLAGIYHAGGVYLDCDEIEVFRIPLTTVEVGP